MSSSCAPAIAALRAAVRDDEAQAEAADDEDAPGRNARVAAPARCGR